MFEDPNGELKTRNVTSDNNSGPVQDKAKKQAAQGFTVDQHNHLRSLNNELFQLRNELSQLKVSNHTVSILSLFFYCLEKDSE